MTDDDNKERKPDTVNNKKKDDNSKYSDVLDMDLKERLYYMFNSFKVGRQWNIVLDELILNTYPDLTPKQLYVYKQIIQTIWDIEFSTAPYNEVAVRILVARQNNPDNPFYKETEPEKIIEVEDTAEFQERTDELFKTGEDKQVEDVVNELSEKGIITWETSTLEHHRRDGTIEVSEPFRVLVMRDSDRENALKAMTEGVNHAFTTYFPDARHYKIDSHKSVEDSRD